MTEVIYKNEERSVLGSIANIRYYHQAAAWNSPLSFGVQAFIEYNGLIMNDRYQSDLIRITRITGLDDAEIRDSREPRAGQSNEYPYDAFYGGRNLVLSGYIEAGNLGALGTLETNLKAAFAPLEESYLKFRWFDISDTFDDPNTILEYNPNASLSGIPSGNYTPLIGSLNNLKVENGVLSWKTGNTKVYFIRTSEKRTFCDVQMTMKCIVGRTSGLQESATEIGFILCAKNDENYIRAVYKEGIATPAISIISVVEGKENTLVSETIPVEFRPVIGQQIWIRGRKEGNIFTIEYWTQQPSNEGLPVCYKSCPVSGLNEELFGDEVLSQVGIAGNQYDTDWAFDELKIESLYPGDIQFKARKISPISIPNEQTSLTKFKRSLQITMKTSDFRAFSSTQINKILYPTSENFSVFLGRSYPRSYPLRYKSYTSSTLLLESNLISINNRGTVFVEPILYLYGPAENIIIDNLTNGQSLEWFGKIGENEYIIIDCKEETIVNSVGSNYIEPLVPTTEWMKLEPMWNDIYITGSGFVEGKTKLVTKMRNGYI